MGLGRFQIVYPRHLLCIVFFINLLTFVGGLVVAAFGVSIVQDEFFDAELLGTRLYAGVVYTLILTGVFVSFISCFGCFVATRKKRYMLSIYIITCLILTTMLVGGILSFMFENKMEQTTRNGMGSKLSNYNTSKPVQELWDSMQSSFQCCGIDGFPDWREVLPNSCCKEAMPGVQYQCQNDENVYKQGCFNPFVAKLKSHATSIGSLAIAVACIMLPAMFFACALLITMVEDPVTTPYVNL